MSSKGALTHLSVLDASDGVAGQYCGRLLSDFGADTVLVEPEGGTRTRGIGPFSERDGEAFLFRHLNFGKHVAERRPGAEESLLPSLVGGADVALLSAGADHGALREANPRLVTCTISDFGEDGPRRHWKGGEMVHQALSGVMYRNGDPARQPLYGCGWRAHYVAGVAAYTAVLAAIFARSRTGRGQHCEIDIAECAASMTYALGTQYNYNGVAELRTTPSNLPSAVLRCRDGWVSVFIYAYRWREACEALGAPQLVDNPRYATAEGRMEHWKEVVAIFQANVRDLPADTVVERLQALGSVAAKAVRPSELLAHPHLNARSYWEEAGGQPVLGPPFRMERTPRALREMHETISRRRAL